MRIRQGPKGGFSGVGYGLIFLPAIVIVGWVSSIHIHIVHSTSINTAKAQLQSIFH